MPPHPQHNDEGDMPNTALPTMHYFVEPSYNYTQRRTSEISAMPDSWILPNLARDNITEPFYPHPVFNGLPLETNRNEQWPTQRLTTYNATEAVYWSHSAFSDSLPPRRSSFAMPPNYTTSSSATVIHPPPRTASPAPLSHKVFRLNCASCDVFFTDRGMRAVLLLRPDIHLYSTDALPVNCSSPPRSSVLRMSEPILRTCQCLTQTICCHGCGAACGYAIVAPCSQCSSTGTPSYNGANGHRFVFHQSGIVAVERRYVKGDPDILLNRPLHPTTFSRSASRGFFRLEFSRPDVIHTSRLFDSGNGRQNTLSEASDELNAQDDDEYKPLSPPHSPSQHAHPPSQEAFQVHSEGPCLREGDIVWWHNLKRTGEIPGVSECRMGSYTHEITMGQLSRSLRALR